MLITLIVLAALNLALSVIVFCSLRVLWARLPEPEQTAEQAAKEWQAQTEAHRVDPPTLTPEELAQVAAYRAQWLGVVTADQSDLEVLALSRLNAT
jgi:mono/diheme cytochrome c family protein